MFNTTDAQLPAQDFQGAYFPLAEYDGGEPVYIPYTDGDELSAVHSKQNSELPGEMRNNFFELLRQSFTQGEAVNLLAWQHGLAPIGTDPWTYKTVKYLIFLKELVRTGRLNEKD